MTEIRTLSLPELSDLHRSRMKKDFPPTELRPFSSMQQLAKAGNYQGVGYFSDDALLAYACLYRADDLTCQLMDLFAVFPNLRGQGIGSRFLSELLAGLSGTDGLFIEAENPDDARSPEEQRLRTRRISFYLKCGAVRTDIRCTLFHVDYEILFLPCPGCVPDLSRLRSNLEALYRRLYARVYGTLCRLR